MGMITVEAIDSSSDDELFSLLGHELERRISAARGSLEFVAEIQKLPVGLRAMAATYELDVSLVLDDLGWHFGNWHNADLAEETARGLEELGAADLAKLFRKAFQMAQEYWTELGAEDWKDWYHGSAFEKAVGPLTEEAWAILEDKKDGIFKYWVDYARRHPERVGASDGEAD
jgi:hypothetical protein